MLRVGSLHNGKVDKIYVPELNLGQMVHPIKEAAEGNAEIIQIPKTGGLLHSPEEIINVVIGKEKNV